MPPRTAMWIRCGTCCRAGGRDMHGFMDESWNGGAPVCRVTRRPEESKIQTMTHQYDPSTFNIARQQQRAHCHIDTVRRTTDTAPTQHRHSTDTARNRSGARGSYDRNTDGHTNRLNGRSISGRTIERTGEGAGQGVVRHSNDQCAVTVL